MPYRKLEGSKLNTMVKKQVSGLKAQKPLWIELFPGLTHFSWGPTKMDGSALWSEVAQWWCYLSYTELGKKKKSKMPALLGQVFK